MAFKYPAVSRHSIARFKDHDIAHCNVFALYYTDFSVTQYLGSRGGHLHQGFHGSLGFALLYERHGCINDHDHEDHQNIGKV